MGLESDDKLNSQPAVSAEAIKAALEALKAQGADVNPYSVALQVEIAPEYVFINKEFMDLIAAARGDQTTYSIDAQLLGRCQEMEAEVAKVMEINQQIYDRALEMEERAIQLEAKLADMEEDAEKLTMQLQNSWSLGYKKGQYDAQTEAAKEAPSAANALIDFELPAEEKAIETKSRPLIDIELPKEEKRSIKSMIDFELPPEDALAHTSEATSVEVSSNVGKDTSDNPPVSGDYDAPLAVPTADAPVAEVGANITDAGAAASGASYNDRVYNAVNENHAPGNMLESVGGMSWREVETIYQYSSNSAASPANLVFEPMNPGAGNGGANRSETQPLTTTPDQNISQTENPNQNQNKTIAPPILKADAPGPRSNANRPVRHSSTYQNLSGMGPKTFETEPEPPMELTMHQFMGATESYLNLDRVTMDPLEEPTAPVLSREQELIKQQEMTQNIPVGQDLDRAKILAQSQQMIQNITGGPAKPNLEGATRAEAESHAAQAPEAKIQPHAEPVQTATPSVGPGDAKWGRRDAGATYDSLTAVASDSTADVLDLEKLDIFEGLEDIEDLSQIEIIEDVIIPGATLPREADARKRKTSDHIPVVSSDDLHDLIKSRIKKAEEPHEPPRVDAFIPHAHGNAAAAGAQANSAVNNTATPQAANNAAAEAQPTAQPNLASGAAAGTASGTTSGAADGAAAEAPVPTAKELEALRQGARNKFVGGKAGPAPGTASSVSNDSLASGPASAPASTGGVSARAVPPEIRKACMILGVRPEEMTLKEVHEKWKAQIAAPGAHPDQGGDTESAIYLNTAKDTLVKWINDQAPKLGKKFGKQ